uniref:Endonuclease/exonuclease/phosphatase domain-containing protein n=1 Tax=Latimeria chalumnae TaxID=7897 RepID=H3B2J8_LATCH
VMSNLGHLLKTSSWNVNGINAYIKRKMVINYLGSKKSEIVPLHLTPSDSWKLRGNWIGQVIQNLHKSKSRGVAILFEIRDEEGQILILVLLHNNQRIAHANIYTPNTVNTAFFITLQTLFAGVQVLPLIIGGDFNQILDPLLDRSVPERLSRPPPDRLALLPLRTRIDMFLVSKILVNSVQSCNIGVRAITDHAPVDFLLFWELGVARRGRWRLNSSLLHSYERKEEVRLAINEFFYLNTGTVESDTTLWEAAKAFCRGRCMAMASRVCKEKLHRMKELEGRLVCQQEAKRNIHATKSAQGDLIIDQHKIN